jgi:cellulose synthase operon protein C
MRRALAVAALGCLLGLASVSAQDRELFLEAENRYSAGDYLLAIQRYDNLIDEYPQSEFVPDAQYRKAVSLYRVGRYSSSLALLRRVETRFRSTRYLPFVPFWKGVNLYALDQFEQSIEELTRFLGLDVGAPELTRAYLYRALSRIALGQEEGAAEDLRIIFDSRTPEEEPYAATLLASLLVQNGELEEVLALAEPVSLDRFDATWRPRFSLYVAEAFLGLGDTQEASDRFRSLLEGPPEVAAVAYRRLFTLVSPEERQSLVEMAELSFASQPRVLQDLWLRLGSENYSEGRLEIAELYLRRAWSARESYERTESREDAVTAAVYLGRTLSDQGRQDAADAHLDEALRWSNRESPALLLRRAVLDVDREQWSAAAGALESLLERFPDFGRESVARYHLAYSYFYLGRLQDAQETLETVDPETIPEAQYHWFRYLLARESDRIDEALGHLRAYLRLRPNDTEGGVAYLTLLYRNGRHTEVVREADGLKERGLATGILDYLASLSLVAEKRYQEAAERFQGVLPLFEAPEPPSELRGLEASTLYYYAWSEYRIGNYAAARNALSRFMRRIESHSLRPRALYLLGQVSYAEGDLQAAEAAFRRAISSEGAGDALVAEATFVLGQLYRLQGDDDAALREFSTVVTRWGDTSPLADDALFEAAQIHNEAGRIDRAVGLLLEVYQRYPRSPLGEEALYRRGELLHNDGRYSAARDAFFEYRRNYPAGRFVDASLYWGGVASFETGEETGALLLWERLSEDYPSSPFRGEALARAADLYEDRGDLRKALDSLSELSSRYPEQAEAVDARKRTDELILRIGGLSEEEARLWVAIDDGDRSQSPAGRDAILQLAAYILYEGSADRVSSALVVDLLEETAERETETPRDAAQALFYLGEFSARSGELEEAARFFLNAAGAGSGDLSARSLYKAVEMKTRSRRFDEAREILQRMENAIPGSDWTAEARRILRGADS